MVFTFPTRIFAEVVFSVELDVAPRAYSGLRALWGRGLGFLLEVAYSLVHLTHLFVLFPIIGLTVASPSIEILVNTSNIETKGDENSRAVARDLACGAYFIGQCETHFAKSR